MPPFLNRRNSTTPQRHATPTLKLLNATATKTPVLLLPLFLAWKFAVKAVKTSTQLIRENLKVGDIKETWGWLLLMKEAF